MIKILTVIGARPQFVKAAVISRAVAKHDHVTELIVHTGQHYDKNMSDIFFEEMEIPTPHYRLDINGLSHGAMTGRMIEELEQLFMKEKPNYVLVFGDTNSTLAAALAAKKLALKTIHIEAGVRNFDDYMPEEINRYTVDRMAELNFACTWLGVENLEKEGFNTENINSKVYNYGDVMFDAALYYKNKAQTSSDILPKLNLENKKYTLCTVHRASNTDNEESLRAIIESLNEINKDMEVICPIHPRTRNLIAKLGLKTEFRVLDPIGYFDMLQLIMNCNFVITDSGGLVREAYFFKKPSILLLEKPLWPELVLEKVCFNTIPQKEAILNVAKSLDGGVLNYQNNIFGEGKAGDKIIQAIIDDYNER